MAKTTLTAPKSTLRKSKTEVTLTQYQIALRMSIKALQDADIAVINSDARRPVHLARDLGKSNTRDLLNAPLNQDNPLTGLLAKRVQLVNGLERHLAQVSHLLGTLSDGRKKTAAKN